MDLLKRLPERPAPRRVAFVVAIVLLVRVVLIAIYNVFGDLQRGAYGTAPVRFLDELTAYVTALPLTVLVVLAAASWPLRSPAWKRHLFPLVLTFLVYTGLRTTAMESLRVLTYPIIELNRSFDASRLLLAIGHELPNDLFYFALIVGTVEFWRFSWQAYQNEQRSNELARSLAEARLATLRLQLQPHFLFNALNTVSATMYEDPRKADEMLVELSELLRSSLRQQPGDEVPLREELEIVQRYVRLQQARFGERLEVRVDASPDSLSCRVPIFLLQPLVENAVRHGGVERRGHGCVEVKAHRRGDRLEIIVWDDGGTSSAVPSAEGGLGLRATRERLHLRHGDSATVEAGPADAGWRVRLLFPCCESSA